MILRVMFLLAMVLPVWGEGPMVEIMEPNYVPGQDIRFKITLEDEAYLYIFNLDTKSGRLLLIWPAPAEEPKTLAAGQRVVPHGNESFFSEESGMEHFLFVTSTHPLPFNILSSGGGQQPGVLPLMETLLFLEDQKTGVTELDIFIGDLKR